MKPDQIDDLITGGSTSVANCFALEGCIYCYVPDLGEFTWVSEHDESKYLLMINRLTDLGQSYNNKTDLEAGLAKHHTLSSYADFILSNL
jgi:hypothetical protein